MGKLENKFFVRVFGTGRYADKTKYHVVAGQFGLNKREAEEMLETQKKSGKVKVGKRTIEKLLL